MARIGIIDWALQLAELTAQRSEDPYRKVGAVAINHENRVIATAYNGLMPGFAVQDTFWNDREKRQDYMIHAEQNLCSLITRGEVKFVALTTQPCNHCMLTLAAHDIREIHFRETYERGCNSFRIAQFYGIKLVHTPCNISQHGQTEIQKS